MCWRLPDAEFNNSLTLTLTQHRPASSCKISATSVENAGCVRYFSSWSECLRGESWTCPIRYLHQCFNGHYLFDPNIGPLVHRVYSSSPVDQLKLPNHWNLDKFNFFISIFKTDFNVGYRVISAFFLAPQLIIHHQMVASLWHFLRILVLCLH